MNKYLSFKYMESIAEQSEQARLQFSTVEKSYEVFP
jgi:hypothetical protein